jgi:uncharacterized protein (DUF2147 family)
MEIEMKQIWIGAAAIALMATSAHAGQVFEFGINGGTGRIEIPKNCHDFSCLNLSFTDESGKGHTAKDLKNVLKNFDDKAKDDSDDTKVSDAPVASPFTSHSKTSTAPAGGGTAAGKLGGGTMKTPAGSSSRPHSGSVDTTQPTTSSDEPARQTDVAPSKGSDIDRITEDSPAHGTDTDSGPGSGAAAASKSETGPTSEVVATRDEPAAHSMTRPATGPVGEWLVEDGTAQIRIEECGSNLCGYVSHAKDETATDSKNPNPALRKRSVIGMPVLIDMKPAKNRWEGKIYNAKDGSMYSAHIEMRNANTLRVEGCAFGGLFCGGQNWKRAS